MGVSKLRARISGVLLSCQSLCSKYCVLSQVSYVVTVVDHAHLPLPKRYARSKPQQNPCRTMSSRLTSSPAMFHPCPHLTATTMECVRGEKSQVIKQAIELCHILKPRQPPCLPAGHVSRTTPPFLAVPTSIFSAGRFCCGLTKPSMAFTLLSSPGVRLSPNQTLVISCGNDARDVCRAGNCVRLNVDNGERGSASPGRLSSATSAQSSVSVAAVNFLARSLHAIDGR